MRFSKTKERRKHAKYRDMLDKLFTIDLKDSPTQNLVICNGGLTNGLSQEIIVEALEPHGKIISIVLPPRESLSFIQFESVDAASAALENATELVWPGGGPAYLAYVDRIPPLPSLENNFVSPPGLLVLEEFVTEAEETELLNCLHMNISSSNLKHRTVKHFGYEFQYSDNRANSTPIAPMPREFALLWPRLLKMKELLFEPDQCTVNLYTPGDGIPPHVDTHSAFTEYIVSLSLLSDIVMDWRKEGDVRQVLLPRRSLCVMTGESRYAWRHGITGRKNDVVHSSNGLTTRRRSTRVSLTFRRTRSGECNCCYPALCDTVIHRMEMGHKEATTENAAQLELASVHRVYNEIADHFCETRQKPWPNVIKFLNSFSAGSLLFDVGCGSGRYLNAREDAVLLGCDRSCNLLSLCQAAGHPVFLCDCLQIPVRDESMDGCICIAVIHHLSTEERRFAALQEITRILRIGGRALIYVWSKDQEADSSKSSYLKQKKRNKQKDQVEEDTPSVASVSKVVLPVHTNRTNFEHSDVFVPWQLKPGKCAENGPVFLRYYHVFENLELKTLAEKLDGVRCLEHYYDQGNWCVMLEKMS